MLKDSTNCYIMPNNKNIYHYLDVIDKSKLHWSQGLVHKDIWEAELVAKILRHKAMKYKRDVPDIIREER